MQPSIEQQLLQTQDQLEGAINQRNASQNECVILHGQIKALQRHTQQLETRVQELEAQLAQVPKPNGKADEAATA